MKLNIIAPLPNIAKRTRLVKIEECGKKVFSVIEFYGWQRLPNEHVDNHRNVLLKGGGYSSKKARLMYFIWMIKVFFLSLTFKKDEVVWALGFESALPSILAAKIKGYRVIYDDADRFSSLFNYPNIIKNIIIRLEKYSSVNAFKHIIPGIERYDFDSPNFFILKNTPTREDMMKADKFDLDEKIVKFLSNFSFIIYVNGWLNEGRGLKIIYEVAQKTPMLGFLLAGRIDSKFAENMLALENVIYLGEVPQYEALAYYRVCNFVFTYYDPKIPINRLAEANKWGDALQYTIPVIVNSEVVTAQYLRDAGASISVDYENAEHLIKELQDVLNTGCKYQDLVNSMSKLQRKFPTFDVQLEKLFQEMR